MARGVVAAAADQQSGRRWGRAPRELTMRVVLFAAVIWGAGVMHAPPLWADPGGAIASSQAGRAETAPAAAGVPKVAPAELRAQLDDLMRRMSDAVRAADPAAYLSCVSLVDPCFATEQKNWAKDL